MYPGETIQYQLWKQGDKVVFSATTKERGKEII
jgi:hypothetical protein